MRFETMRSPMLLAAASLLLAGCGGNAPPAIHLRGNAYVFNVGTPIAGATIRVAEVPGVQATTGSDGGYDLRVPDQARITPYIVADGFHTIYLQTFRSAGRDLDKVNFQTPSDEVYPYLAMAVGWHGGTSGCTVVSTVSQRQVQALSFLDFMKMGAHGVAGATVSGTPAIGQPIYFNAQVQPDPRQASTSVDGGVAIANLMDGRYTISASHPDKRFASFDVDCKEGRVINANPPWGLAEQ